jgi:hypothetical protein
VCLVRGLDRSDLGLFLGDAFGDEGTAGRGKLEWVTSLRLEKK